LSKGHGYQGNTKVDTGSGTEHGLGWAEEHSSKHKGITPQNSVDNKFAHKDVPGGGQTGESGKGSWIDGEGPNPGSGHVKVPIRKS